MPKPQNGNGSNTPQTDAAAAALQSTVLFGKYGNRVELTDEMARELAIAALAAIGIVEG